MSNSADHSIRFALIFLFATACTATTPASLGEPIVAPPGPSCDQQVDDAVAARNGANAAANGAASGPGGSGAVVGWGFGTPGDNAAVDQLVYQFQVANSALYTPPASLTGSGTSIPYQYFEPPAISISATYQNHLMFARAYGYGDPTNGVYAEPDSRYRLASVSKTFTGMGILKLVHDGQLSLDYQPFADSAFVDFLGGAWQSGSYDTSKCGKPINTSMLYHAGGCGGVNPELSKITVRDLLHHAGGWDRTLPGVGDAIGLAWPPSPIVSDLGLKSGPPACRDIVRYFLDQPLQHEPGTVSAYSNLGFCALGEVIAFKSGASYSSSYVNYIDQNVFKPLGMVETAPGATLESGLLDREVAYFDNDPNTPPGTSVYGTTAPAPYSGVYMESMEPSGGWVSSAIDLARFGGSIASLQLPNFPPTASDSTWPAHFATYTEEEEPYDSTVWTTRCYPLGCVSTESAATDWFGMGWDNIWTYGTTPQTYYWDKGGGMPGTSTLIAIHGDDDWTVTVLMNSTPPDECGLDPKCIIPYDIYTLAWNVWYYLQNWTTDFFPQYSASSYGAWQSPSDFDGMLATAQSSNQYPSRVDGRTIKHVVYPRCTPAQLSSGTCPPPTTEFLQQYRARLATPAATAVAPAVLRNQTCDQMTAALQSSANGPLVSLQKFYDQGSSSWRYQAVFAAP